MATPQAHDGTGFKQDMNRLGQGVDTIKSDVNTLAHGAVDAARSGVAELRQGAQNAVDAAKDKYEVAKEKAVDAADSVKDMITRNPMASIGIAAGAGLLLGLILSRPRS